MQTPPLTPPPPSAASPGPAATYTSTFRTRASRTAVDTEACTVAMLQPLRSQVRRLEPRLSAVERMTKMVNPAQVEHMHQRLCRLEDIILSLKSHIPREVFDRGATFAAHDAAEGTPSRPLFDTTARRTPLARSASSPPFARHGDPAVDPLATPLQDDLDSVSSFGFGGDGTSPTLSPLAAPAVTPPPVADAAAPRARSSGEVAVSPSTTCTASTPEKLQSDAATFAAAFLAVVASEEQQRCVVAAEAAAAIATAAAHAAIRTTHAAGDHREPKKSASAADDDSMREARDAARDTDSLLDDVARLRRDVAAAADTAQVALAATRAAGGPSQSSPDPASANVQELADLRRCVAALQARDGELLALIEECKAQGPHQASTLPARSSDDGAGLEARVAALEGQQAAATDMLQRRCDATEADLRRIDRRYAAAPAAAAAAGPSLVEALSRDVEALADTARRADRRARDATAAVDSIHDRVAAAEAAAASAQHKATMACEEAAAATSVSAARADRAAGHRSEVLSSAPEPALVGSSEEATLVRRALERTADAAARVEALESTVATTRGLPHRVGAVDDAVAALDRRVARVESASRDALASKQAAEFSNNPVVETRVLELERQLRATNAAHAALQDEVTALRSDTAGLPGLEQRVRAAADQARDAARTAEAATQGTRDVAREVEAVAVKARGTADDVWRLEREMQSGRAPSVLERETAHPSVVSPSVTEADLAGLRRDAREAADRATIAVDELRREQRSMHQRLSGTAQVEPVADEVARLRKEVAALQHADSSHSVAAALEALRRAHSDTVARTAALEAAGREARYTEQMPPATGPEDVAAPKAAIASMRLDPEALAVHEAALDALDRRLTDAESAARRGNSAAAHTADDTARLADRVAELEAGAATAHGRTARLESDLRALRMTPPATASGPSAAARTTPADDGFDASSSRAALSRLQASHAALQDEVTALRGDSAGVAGLEQRVRAAADQARDAARTAEAATQSTHDVAREVEAVAVKARGTADDVRRLERDIQEIAARTSEPAPRGLRLAGPSLEDLRALQDAHDETARRVAGHERLLEAQAPSQSGTEEATSELRAEQRRLQRQLEAFEHRIAAPPPPLSRPSPDAALAVGADVAGVRRDVASLAGELDALRRQQAEARDAVAAVRRDVASTGAASSDLHDLQQQLGSLRREVQGLARGAADAELATRVAALEAQPRLADRVSRAERGVADGRAATDDAQRRLDRLERDVKAAAVRPMPPADAEHDSPPSAGRVRRDDLAARLVSLDGVVSGLKGDVARQGSQLDALSAKQQQQAAACKRAAERAVDKASEAARALVRDASLSPPRVASPSPRREPTMNAEGLKELRGDLKDLSVRVARLEAKPRTSPATAPAPVVAGVSEQQLEEVGDALRGELRMAVAAAEDRAAAREEEAVAEVEAAKDEAQCVTEAHCDIAARVAVLERCHGDTALQMRDIDARALRCDARVAALEGGFAVLAVGDAAGSAASVDDHARDVHDRLGSAVTPAVLSAVEKAVEDAAASAEAALSQLRAETAEVSSLAGDALAATASLNDDIEGLKAGAEAAQRRAAALEAAMPAQSTKAAEATAALVDDMRREVAGLRKTVTRKASLEDVQLTVAREIAKGGPSPSDALDAVVGRVEADLAAATGRLLEQQLASTREWAKAEAARGDEAVLAKVAEEIAGAQRSLRGLVAERVLDHEVRRHGERSAPDGEAPSSPSPSHVIAAHGADLSAAPIGSAASIGSAAPIGAPFPFDPAALQRSADAALAAKAPFAVALGAIAAAVDGLAGTSRGAPPALFDDLTPAVVREKAAHNAGLAAAVAAAAEVPVRVAHILGGPHAAFAVGCIKDLSAPFWQPAADATAGASMERQPPPAHPVPHPRRSATPSATRQGTTPSEERPPVRVSSLSTPGRDLRRPRPHPVPPPQQSPPREGYAGRQGGHTHGVGPAEPTKLDRARHHRSPALAARTPQALAVPAGPTAATPAGTLASRVLSGQSSAEVSPQLGGHEGSEEPSGATLSTADLEAMSRLMDRR